MKLANEIKIQEELKKRVITEDCFHKLNFIAGCDTSSQRFCSQIHAGIVMMKRNEWKKLTTASATAMAPLPYIPGFLAFREIPSVLAAFEKIQERPDLICVDGLGICHPRGLGIASHLGVVLDLPTIGIGKSILVGEPAGVLGTLPGDTVDLLWKGKRIGLLLRTKKNCKPIIVSCGHKISLQTALDLVLESLKGYRLPEPTRLAHATANQERVLHKGEKHVALTI